VRSFRSAVDAPSRPRPGSPWGAPGVPAAALAVLLFTLPVGAREPTTAAPGEARFTRPESGRPIAALEAASTPRVETFSVRNEPVDQVILAFAEAAGLSVLLDETVSGTVSLVLHEASPLETLQAIADAANLYLSDRDGIVRVSRLRLDRAPGGRWILESRGGSLSAITRALTASAGASVVLPHREYPPITVSLTARTLGGLVAQLAEAIGASVSQRSGLYVIGDDDAVVSDPESFADSPAPREMPRLTRHAGDVALSVSGARRIDILRALAADLGLPLIICGDLSSVIGEIELSAPEDRFLPVLATALHVRIYRDGGSLVVVDEYDSGRLRGLYHRTLLPVPPAHRPLIREAASTVPDLHIEGESARGLVVTGMESSLRRIETLLRELEDEESALVFLRYRATHRSAAELLSTANLRFPADSLSEVSAGGYLVGWVANDRSQEIANALAEWDRPDLRRRYRCRFVPVSVALEAVERLHPGIVPVTAGDGSSFSLQASPGVHTAVAELLLQVDRPPEQLRFDLCIIQYQSGNAVQHGVDFAVSSVEEFLVFDEPISAAGSFNGILALQFDLISRLGYQAALAISDELSTNRARLVLDTSLRALSGKTARLENSSTFRYRDVLGEEDEASWRSVVREIESGLSLEITGDVHDDRSITVTIVVDYSRQGADVSRNGDPPPTSERVVESTLRVVPGEPVVIGGLLQQEESASERRFPLLGRVPLIRGLINRRDRHFQETELVLYLSAFPDPASATEERRRQLERLMDMEAAQ
jgi:general secretion pathway protein D